MIYKALVIFSVFIAACAQMLLKKGALIQYDSFIRQYLNVWVISGYSIMMLSMVLNIYAMSKGVMVKEVSIIESLSYMFVPMLSWFIFKEKLTPKKILAIAVIICGVGVFFY
jgi:uncharacterized membrane protein